MEFAGAVYHITARGNARQPIYSDDRDKHRFLDLLGREVHQQAWECYAYCLMPNHYHLLLETPQGNLVAGMRRLNGVYTQYVNYRHGRVGHLFQGRYKSIVVDRESFLLELCRYIVLNPVRAAIVKKAGDWPWSSYRATAGFRDPPDWLDTRWILGQFGTTEHAALAAYRRFVEDGKSAVSPWKNLRGQIWLGSENFLTRMEERLLRYDKPLNEVPVEQTQPMRPRKEEILGMVSRVYGAEERNILGRRHREAYQAAAYLLRRVANLGLKEVAEIFAVSPPRISHIQHRIETEQQGPQVQDLLKLYKVKN